MAQFRFQKPARHEAEEGHLRIGDGDRNPFCHVCSPITGVVCEVHDNATGRFERAPCRRRHFRRRRRRDNFEFARELSHATIRVYSSGVHYHSNFQDTERQRQRDDSEETGRGRNLHPGRAGARLALATVSRCGCHPTRPTPHAPAPENRTSTTGVPQRKGAMEWHDYQVR